MKTLDDLSSRELAELYTSTGIDLSNLASVAKPVEVAGVIRTTVDELAQDRYRWRAEQGWETTERNRRWHAWRETAGR
jgi:hypothetical protein